MDDWTAAWFALGGVFLGAVITGGFAYWLERRKERTTVRRAARLIDADLMFAEVAARTCVEKKKWWGYDRRLTLDGWREQRDHIAPKLRADDWAAVMVAVVAVDGLQLARDTAHQIQRATMATDPKMAEALASADRTGLDIVDRGPAIPESTVERIEPMLEDLQAGRAALARLARDT